jgi:very-short-patch-repair endonuclease
MPPAHSAAHSAVLHARQTRKELTRAEAVVWSELQRRQLEGFKFRRQVPMGPYFVDFVCFKARLVIEVDGGQHGEPEVEERDAERTAWLLGRGFRVLRFWNSEVLEGMEGVWEVIRIALVGGVPRSELELYEKEGLLQNPSRGLRGNKDGVRLKVPLPYPSRKGKGPVSQDLEDRTA